MMGYGIARVFLTIGLFFTGTSALESTLMLIAQWWLQ